MDSFIAAYITLLVPVPSLVGFGFALFFKLNQKIPLERRRVLFNRSAYVPMIASVCMFVPSAFLFYHSPYLTTWFGGSKAGYILFAILTPIIVLSVLLLAIRVIKRKCSLYSDEPDLRPIGELQRTVNLESLMSLLVFIVFLAYAFCARPYFKAVDVDLGPAFIIRMTVQFFVMIGFFYYISPMRSSQVSEELTERACELAVAMGCRMPVVRLITGSKGQNSVIAVSARKSRIYLSNKLIDALTPEELDRVIAHELGHIKQAEGDRNFSIVLVTWIVSWLQICWCLFAWSVGVKSDAALGILLGGLPGLGVYLAFRKLDQMSTRREYEADRLALEVMRNFDLCKASLMKCRLLSTKRDPHEKAFLTTHPVIWDRLKALRHQAEEMGIVSSENEIEGR